MRRRARVCSWWTCVCLLASALPAHAASDVVLYAGDVTTIRGNWSRAADAGAAGGQRMASSDRGWSAADAPLASPADYFEVPLNVEAGVAYHVWVRMRAAGDSKWNDSVWAQFNTAVSASGSAVYRTGTASGLLLNLERCNACGTSGWGWVDGAYWLGQLSTVRFSGSGPHTMRIQIREDGAEVDQIVLSPAAWLQSSPGQPYGDSTIVPRAGSTQSSPYSGSAIAIPGTIQAEAFDNGGEGVAYHDSDSGNSGGQFRATDVDIEPSSGGGYNIGWIVPGEWLQYSVNVGAAGSYTASFRVASLGQGGRFHLEMNGQDVTGGITIPDTGDWQNWTTLTRTVSLTAGAQRARLVMDTSGTYAVGNIDFVSITAGAGPPPTGGAAPIPGTIEAEQFDEGGPGVAYYDTTPGNSGGVFRSTDVDIEPASGGGYNVGWIDAGEWLRYTVNVSSGGGYTMQARVASLGAGGRFHVEANGANVTGSLAIPDTGGWQNWTTVSASVQLGAGQQTLRIVIDTSGTYAAGNIDRLQFTAGTTQAPPPAPASGVITVQPGHSVQAAIDAANPGDTIVLQPGASYEGGLILRRKSGDAFITIRSAAADSALPGEGVRVGPQHAPQLPKIVGGTAGLPAMMTEAGAHHWRLQHLELVDTWPYGDILALGDGSDALRSWDDIAHDLIVDRVYIHGVPGQEQKRGIALNSASTSIVNSWIGDIRLTNGDAQAIAGWNGPGPFTIVNNYLEATGENFLLGGSDPPLQSLIPSDIVFRRNTVTKQAAWRWQGYTVKNLIEFKNAQRVTIDGNVLEYNWSGGQPGHAIMLTPRNQDGGAPWSVVRQIQITNNVIRHVAGVLNILGTDYRFTSQPLTDITFRNNLVTDLSAANWGGAAQLILTSGGRNITIDHNTVFTDGTSVVYADGSQVSGFVFTNNIVPDNLWGVMGGGASEGNGTLAAFFPNSTFRRNVMIGGQSWLYPGDNYFPASISQVGFVDPSSNFRLSSASPYIAVGTDGKAAGADIGAINAAAGTDY